MTGFWISLGGALVLTALLLPVLRRVGAYDLPNHRSLHATPTPRGGGIAVLLTVALVAVGARDDNSTHVSVLMAAALALGAVGLFDDFRSLPAAFRLAAQAVVALAAVLAVVRLVGDGGLWAPAFVVAGTTATVAYVNAFNFMDGVNSISALNAAVCGGWLAWLGHEYDVAALFLIGTALAGAALGFLPWNASSRVFLGDVGSYGVGVLVASTGVLGWGAGIPLPLVVAPTLVYFADTGWVILKRVWVGQPLTQAHRDHVYQRLVCGGWPHWASAGWSAALAAVTCLLAAVLYDRAPILTVLAVALVLLAYLATPRLNVRAAPDRMGAT